MQPKTPKLLEDIRDAAAFILEIAQGKSLQDYLDDRMLRQTIERNFEIIGEAMSKLARLDLETIEHFEEHPRIIAFRNVLIHGYDIVEPREVWRIVEEHLAELLERTVSQLDEAKRLGLA